MSDGDGVWVASDGTHWVKTPGVDEYTGWDPPEDGCWLFDETRFRESYPEAPDGSSPVWVPVAAE